MKNILQSLSEKQTRGSLFKNCFKISIIIAITSLTACKSTSMVDYEPCSVVDSVKPLSDEEFNQAFAACRQKASSGDPISQKNLAYLYYYGNARIQRDVDQSVVWFGLAAANGNLAAANRLNDMGQGTMLSYNYYSQ